MTTLAERLEELEQILGVLKEENADAPVLVEGEKDERALREIGLGGVILRVNRGATVFEVCETISRRHKHVIVLTDWDRFGGHLSRLIVDACHANGVAVDVETRRALARVTRKEIAQVESLATYLANLRARAA